MTFKYCIGKTSRHSELDTVRGPSLVKAFNDPPDREDVLRMTVYDTFAAAHEAAVEAGNYNPVGFVVLLIEVEA